MMSRIAVLLILLKSCMKDFLIPSFEMVSCCTCNHDFMGFFSIARQGRIHTTVLDLPSINIVVNK